jgi:hypothetical protein
MKAVRSRGFDSLIPPRHRLPRQRQKLMAFLVHRKMTLGVVPTEACVATRVFRLCCGEERRARARVFDWRHYPGPPMRSAWERQCAGPLCLPARALSSVSGGSRWGRCGSRRTGSTTVSVVRCRCVSVNAAITATCTARASAQRSVAASRNGRLRHATRGAAAVRGDTPPGNTGGESDNDKSQK